MEVMHRNKQRRDQAAQEATVGAPAGALSMGQVAEMIGKYTSRQHRPESQTMSLHTKKTVTQFKDYDADLPSTPSTPEPVADKFGFGPTSGGGSGNNLNWGTISSTTPTGLTTDKFDLDTVAERNKKMERETEASEAERETEAVSDPDEATLGTRNSRISTGAMKVFGAVKVPAISEATGGETPDLEMDGFNLSSDDEEQEQRSEGSNDDSVTSTRAYTHAPTSIPEPGSRFIKSNTITTIHTCICIHTLLHTCIHTNYCVHLKTHLNF